MGLAPAQDGQGGHQAENAAPSCAKVTYCLYYTDHSDIRKTFPKAMAMAMNNVQSYEVFPLHGLLQETIFEKLSVQMGIAPLGVVVVVVVFLVAVVVVVSVTLELIVQQERVPTACWSSQGSLLGTTRFERPFNLSKAFVL